MEYFRFRRTAPLGRLILQARENHHSTFSLYNEEEFDEALERTPGLLPNLKILPESGR